MFCIGFLFAQRPSKSVHDKVEIMKLRYIQADEAFVLKPRTRRPA